MKTLLMTLMTCLLGTVSPTVAANTFHVKKVSPPFWWADMKNPQLQIMLYGDDLASADVSIRGEGVLLQETVVLDNPNYLLLYVDLSQAKPQTFDILLQKGRQKAAQFVFLGI